MQIILIIIIMIISILPIIIATTIVLNRHNGNDHSNSTSNSSNHNNSVRRLDVGLFARVLGLVLAEVDVLALPGRGPHLLGHLSPVGHHRVVHHRKPLVLEHVRGVLVAEDRGVLHPGSGIARARRVAPAVDVATADERDRLAVAEKL